MARCLVCNSSYDPETGHGREDCRMVSVDSSIAIQLQRSIERNSRMMNRLRMLEGKIAVTPIASPDIWRAVIAIQKDEEPTWP